MNQLFLISLPRSGSTMMQAVLSNQPEVATCSEPWIQLLNAPFWRPEWIHAPFDWGLTMEAIEDLGGGACYVDHVTTALRGVAEGLYQGSEGAHDAQYFLDKTPRYYFILEELFAANPNAKFIVLLRHPLSVLRSIQRTWGRTGIGMLDRNLCDLLEGPRRLTNFLEMHGDSDRVHTVSFEALTRDPEKHFEGLFTWLGLNFSPEVLEYTKNESYKGKLGDQVGVHKGKVEAAEKERKFIISEEFPDREWIRFAKGYADYIVRENFKNPEPDLWESGTSTSVFREFQRRYKWKCSGDVMGGRDCVRLLMDRFHSRLRGFTGM